MASGSEEEASKLFRASRELGFFLLDLRDNAAGEELRKDIEKLFDIAEDVMQLSFEEKSKYNQIYPTKLIG